MRRQRARVSQWHRVSRGTDTIVRTGRLQPTQDAWADQLRDPAYWASRTVGRGTRPNGTRGSSSGSFWGFGPLPPGMRSNLGIFLPPQLLERRRRAAWISRLSAPSVSASVTALSSR